MKPHHLHVNGQSQKGFGFDVMFVVQFSFDEVLKTISVYVQNASTTSELVQIPSHTPPSPQTGGAELHHTLVRTAMLKK